MLSHRAPTTTTTTNSNKTTLPQVYGLLQLITKGGPEVQQASETLCKVHYKCVLCIVDLFSIAIGGASSPSLLNHPSSSPSESSDSLAVRQLAAIELRKQIRRGGTDDGRWWASLDVSYRLSIKSTLLTQVLLEPNQLIKHSLARVISEIASHELMENAWPELIDFMYQCCSGTVPINSPSALQREIGAYMAYTLFDVIADVMADEHMSRLSSVFANLIQDPESYAVRVTTLQALGKVAEFIEPEDQAQVSAFQALVPSMVAVLQECLAAGDVDGCAKGFDVFDSMLVLEAPLLSAHFSELVQFFVGVGSNTAVDDNLRVNALSFLMWCTVYKKSRLLKLRLVQPLVAALFIVGAEAEPDEDEEDCPSKLAFQIISSLSTHLPPAQVYPDVMALVESNMSNANPNLRKASMLAFAVLVDGCSEFMGARLGDHISLLLVGLQDPDVVVRKAACMALGSVAEKLDVEVASYHSTLLPVLSRLLQDGGDASIYFHVLSALDAILESLGDDILPYLPGVMDRLVYLLENGDAKVRISAVGCIGSAAHASGESFNSYFPVLVQRLMLLMQTVDATCDSAALDLRGVATDTIGAMAEAVGRELFAPYIENSMNLVLHGLTLDDCRLRECSYCFFGVVARVFAEDFAPFLPAIVPPILASCRLEEKPASSSWEIDDQDGDDVISQDDNVRVDKNELDDEDADNDRAFNMNTAIAEEKETSADALGELFAATKTAFLPYLEESLKTLVMLLDHYHPNVRKSTISALFLFLQTFNTAVLFPSQPQGEWVKGLPVASPVDPNFASMIRLIVEGTLSTLQDEDDRMVVAQSLEEFADTLKITGPSLVCFSYAQDQGPPASHLDSLCNIILMVLQKDHLCQSEDMDDEADPVDEEEQAEQDAVLVAGASNCVAALALAAGGSVFTPYFERFLPLISKYYKRNRLASERSVAVGVLGECIAGMGSSISPFTAALLPLLTKALKDEEDDIKSNACFALGALIENSSENLSEYYLQYLQLFHPILVIKGEDSVGNAIDNACGAVSRMILKNPTAVPLAQVLPVLLAQLPLRKDFAENEPVFQCLMMLITSGEEVALGLLSLIMEKIGQTLAIPGDGVSVVLKSHTRQSLAELLVKVESQYPGWPATIASLSPVASAALSQFMTSFRSF